MNNDYLWDRSGDDADIKRLEEQLAVFRYQTFPAPDVTAPEPIAVFARKLRWGFGFAFSAILAVIVGAGIWTMRPISKQHSEVAVNQVISGEPIANMSPQIVPKVSSPDFSLVPSTKAGAEPAAYRPPKRFAHRAARRRIPEPKTEAVKLTPEERAAYDQVVLALSITSSKLKIVQDKVNGDHVGSPTAKDNK